MPDRTEGVAGEPRGRCRGWTRVLCGLERGWLRVDESRERQERPCETRAALWVQGKHSRQPGGPALVLTASREVCATRGAPGPQPGALAGGAPAARRSRRHAVMLGLAGLLGLSCSACHARPRRSGKGRCQARGFLPSTPRVPLQMGFPPPPPPRDALAVPPIYTPPPRDALAAALMHPLRSTPCRTRCNCTGFSFTRPCRAARQPPSALRCGASWDARGLPVQPGARAVRDGYLGPAEERGSPFIVPFASSTGPADEPLPSEPLVGASS